MRASKLNELQSQLHSQGITFAYCGCITENILTGIGSALKNKLESEDVDTRTTRSIFAVFVEQMQNIIRYSARQASAEQDKPLKNADDHSRYGILTIGQVGDDFIIHSGNLIVAADVPGIRARLTDLQNKSPEELKIAYKSQLRNLQELEEGAGVGFMEIARRTSRPIEFEFEEVDDEHTFFAIKATI
ncbi:SiaB family protein kinase [Granulosicoccus sp. 3-233]|uniref:SiaB family protein kinase n=1 Tax=Granulosicoccus sp. 3-233 TaxID=3417969 RepID=UPI003D3348A2